ncbi:MAG: TonB family protein [Pyrinomonadaceae bacterium]
MPLNVRRYCTSVLLVLVGFIGSASAQTVASAQTQGVALSSGDLIRDRISKSKAFVAVGNYNAAIVELESIRRESGDTAVQSVASVLLMNSYLEQGDYRRAQDLLKEFYALQKTTTPNASASYMAVAGNIIKGARTRVERYRALGLSVSDRTLPLEALNDLERLRETLELVITQVKEIGTNKAKTPDAMAMLEEAGNSRTMLARDDYDSRRWKDEVADTREKMANSNTVVTSSVNVPQTEAAIIAAAVMPAGTAPVMQPVLQKSVEKDPPASREREVKSAEQLPAESAVAQKERPVIVVSSASAAKEEAKPAELVNTEAVNDNSPLDVGGSLIQYATSQAKPVYPPAAKVVRATGVVKVEITVDETGDVTEVQKTSGPSLLQTAAKDAIRKWKFKPFMRDGQPVKAIGYVNFNFSL